MDLRDTPEEAQFRAELRAWIDENLTDEIRRGRFEEAGRDWSRKLYEAGYAGLTWPKEYGGAGAPYSHQAIFLEEMARAEAPSHLGVIGLGMAGPTIIAHGTEAQKQGTSRRSSRPRRSGARASPSRTRAPTSRPSGRARGSRWTASTSSSTARRSGRRSRTSPTGASSSPAATRTASAHAGLTYLLVDMHAPGVEVRPLRQITGEAEFNEIFFTDVEVPVENVVGEIGGGWQVAMTTLLHERGTLGFALTAGLESQIRKLIALAKERGATEVLRDAIAREWIGLQAVRYTNYRSLTTLMKTGIPGPEGSGSKLWWSEENQRVTKLALELLGSEAQLLDGDGHAAGYWQHQQLRSRGNTIEAGTSEILRNIIAERVLGLPRMRARWSSRSRQEQEELRREARAFLEANPDAPLAELRELGWVGGRCPRSAAAAGSRSSTRRCSSRRPGARSTPGRS